MSRELEQEPTVSFNITDQRDIHNTYREGVTQFHRESERERERDDVCEREGESIRDCLSLTLSLLSLSKLLANGEAY